MMQVLKAFNSMNPCLNFKNAYCILRTFEVQRITFSKLYNYIRYRVENTLSSFSMIQNTIDVIKK